MWKNCFFFFYGMTTICHILNNNVSLSFLYIYIREYIHSGRTTCGAHMQKGTINFRCAAHVSLYSPFAAPLRVHWWRAISLSFIFAEAWLIRNTYMYMYIRTFSSVKCPFLCAYVRAADYSYQHCLRCVRTLRIWTKKKKNTWFLWCICSLYMCVMCACVTHSFWLRIFSLCCICVWCSIYTMLSSLCSLLFFVYIVLIKWWWRENVFCCCKWITHCIAGAYLAAYILVLL